MHGKDRPLPADPPHLYIGWHEEHGFVAASGRPLTDHLKNWVLDRVQFEPIPGTTLHRLTEPGQDGPRRARQAVAAIRTLGLRVQADFTLDPELTPDAPHQQRTTNLQEHRSRIAQAANSRSPQRATPHTTLPHSPAATTPAVPRPAAATSATGRGR
ncbi:hypothetical protein [Streptomyces erythrochromogenes]|uniref:hypothetical protein n=1 Tax=Streptomyces erythrochromogenes TaxID=285574 RepID=UPI0037F84A8C